MAKSQHIRVLLVRSGPNEWDLAGRLSGCADLPLAERGGERVREVTSELALLEEDGRASQLLSLVGPLLKGSLWEATAVPELRVHAANVAARVHASLEAAHPAARATAQLP